MVHVHNGSLQFVPAAVLVQHPVALLIHGRRRPAGLGCLALLALLLLRPRCRLPPLTAVALLLLLRTISKAQEGSPLFATGCLAV